MDKIDYFEVGDFVTVKGIDERYVIAYKKGDLVLLVDMDGDELGYIQMDLLECE